MIDEAIQMYEEIRAATLTADVRLKRLQAITGKEVRTMTELADLAYACNEVAKLTDSTRKEANRLKELCEKLVGALWVQQDTGDPVRTEYVTASPDVMLAPKVPDRRKDPAAFATLMNHFGIKPELWNVADEDSCAVQPHWPGMLSYAARLMKQGLPMPPGVTFDTYPIFKLKLRARKEVSGALVIAD